MSLRESINQSPKLAGGIVAGCVLAALVLVVAHVMDLRASPVGGGVVERAFFTVDDGKTWFVDDASQLAPFQHKGAEAVRAYVCEFEGKRFVNHLERYTDEGKKAMARLREVVKKGPPPGQLVSAAQQKGREVKRPGDAKWVSSANGTAAAAVTMLKRPDGAPGEPKLVFP